MGLDQNADVSGSDVEPSDVGKIEQLRVGGIE